MAIDKESKQRAKELQEFLDEKGWEIKGGLIPTLQNDNTYTFGISVKVVAKKK